MDGSCSKGPHEQPGSPGHPMGAGAVPGTAPWRCRRQPSADEAACASKTRRRSTPVTAATIRVKQVSKRFGKLEAVRATSFDLSAGETVALVGHNGAGKTTLMKLMLGLIRPSSGNVEVLGDDPAAGQFAARRALGYL